MNSKQQVAANCFRGFWLVLTGIFTISTLLAGCDPSVLSENAVDFTPLPGEDWEVSTPEAEGLDPDKVASLYRKASRLDTIYSLLIIKNDKLVAEQYFNGGSIHLKSNLQSVTKSYISALVGLAYKQSCLTNLNQPFLDFFPEYVDRINDARKKRITIRHLLQMRSGYPWEESHPDLWNGLLTGDYFAMMVHYPLVSSPGTAFHYSNVSPHYLGAVVARACDTDLKTFASENLFAPLGADLGEWYTLGDGYPMGSTGIHVNARDIAKFGLLYLNDGEFDGEQIIPSDWVRDSLKVYSKDAWTIRIGRNFKDIGYGYQWWSARAGDHHFNFAWGHGGQVVAVVDEFDMLIVVTADPFWQQHDDNSWKHEKANLNLVADFIASLPSD